MAPRSYLFVPGNRPERFARAFGCGADAVVLDLEDAVAPQHKAGARDAVAQWFASASGAERARAVVRINRADLAEDLALLRTTHPPAVMLPKAEGPAQVAALRAAVPACRVLALIESAVGVAMAYVIARTEGVERLVFGTLDYAVDLDLDIEDGPEGLVYAAGALAIASRAAGLPAPVAGVTPQVDNESRLLGDLAWARRHGFDAKLCIHPKQVAPVHDALTPTPQAVQWARRVLAADAASPGAAQLDGRMIDRPIVHQAERTLQRAGH